MPLLNRLKLSGGLSKVCSLNNHVLCSIQCPSSICSSNVLTLSCMDYWRVPKLVQESNQTFMLNHETIRTQSANKSRQSLSSVALSPAGHLTRLFIWSSGARGQKVDRHSTMDKRSGSTVPTVCMQILRGCESAFALVAHLWSAALYRTYHRRS